MEDDQDYFDPYTHAYETDAIEPEILDAREHPHPEVAEALEPVEFTHTQPETLEPIDLEAPEVESLEPVSPADGEPAESLEPLDFSPSEASELDLASPSAEVDTPEVLDPVALDVDYSNLEPLEPLDFHSADVAPLAPAEVQVPPWTRHFPGSGYLTARTHWGS